MLGFRRLEPDLRDLELAGVEPTRSDDEPDLPAVHRHGHIRANCSAGNLSGRCVDTGGDVDRNDGNAGAVDALDQRGRIGARPTAEARAEQRIDDDVRGAVELLARLTSRLREHAERDPAVASVRPRTADGCDSTR